MILENVFKILCAHGRKIVAVLALIDSGSVHLRVESQCSGNRGRDGSVKVVRTESGAMRE